MAGQKLFQWSLVSLLFSFFVVCTIPVQAHDELGARERDATTLANNRNQSIGMAADCRVGSTAQLCAGNLNVDYVLPAYRSLGVSRSLRFVYNSTAADVRPILDIEFPQERFVRPVSYSFSLLVRGQPVGNEIFYNANAPDNRPRIAMQFDANGLTTGLYPYTMQIKANYSNTSATIQQLSSRALVNNERNSPFGAGWTLEGLQRLRVLPENQVVLTEGDGSAKVFSFDTGFNFNRNYHVGVSARAVVVGDFNGDGIPDLAVANAHSHNVSILLGNGDGTLQAAQNFRVGSQPFSVAVGNFDSRNGRTTLDLATAIAFKINILAKLALGRLELLIKNK